MTKRFSASLFIVGTISFLMILISVMHHAAWVAPFDAMIRTGVRSLSSSLMDSISIAITSIGNPYSIMILTTIVTLGLLSFKQWAAACFLVINMTVFSTLNYLIKMIIQRPRPPFHHLVYAGGYSFPSGHASGALLFLGTLSILVYYLIHQPVWQKIVIGSCLILALGIGLSRIYVLVHYPSDVLAGFLLATACLGGSWYCFIHFKLLHLKES
ncbi:phosphatase PAP2 family protein [Latilactobacillus fragifolii]|uniref:phosphatase PAP2 family protein n=1 Tax=Latilactobacillus fragifolii TaxID=2814244 RepID=UPI001ABA6B94|nr:phosphatase PAP2 family protein [Latilactobacillus fragifolii]